MPSANLPGRDSFAASTPEERRRNLRFPISATLEAVETRSGTKLTGRTSDLGLGGCYVDTLSPFPIGAELKIRIVRGSETFEAQAKVVYSVNGLGMGLAFVSAQPKHLQLFQKWLLEISGQAAATPGSDTPQPEAATPDAAEIHSTQPPVNTEVLSNLILTLMKKNVLTEAEGKELLRRMFT